MPFGQGVQLGKKELPGMVAQGTSLFDVCD
jgi:hypothetical protein